MLRDILKQNKSEIKQKWFDLIIESYPADSASFFKQVKNRFGNPVGYTIAREIESLYDILMAGNDDNDNDDRLYTSLDNIIKIRAVQDFSASQAVNFVFLLKKAIRNYVQANISEKRIFIELLDLESRIDKFALCSFDVYMNCREKISQIKVNETKRQTFTLIKKINVTSGGTAKTKDQ